MENEPSAVVRSLQLKRRTLSLSERSELGGVGPSAVVGAELAELTLAIKSLAPSEKNRDFEV